METVYCMSVYELEILTARITDQFYKNYYTYSLFQFEENFEESLNHTFKSYDKVLNWLN